MSEIRVRELVTTLNTHRNLYYNENAPKISDAEYDTMFDELAKLEKTTGIILANSPTQTVGFTPISNLTKTKHLIPLLSLDKTKDIAELAAFTGGHIVLAMLKMDGLTLKLIYENGKLVEASTRGDGETGEDVTHNIPAIADVPIEIPYKNRLVVTGEGHILDGDFNIIKHTLVDSTSEPYKNSRSLASGSVRNLDPGACVQRRVRFTPFNVLEGLNEDPSVANSKFNKLLKLNKFGFSRCMTYQLHAPTTENLQQAINMLKDFAEKNGIPIDGIVVTFDDIEFSRSCGATGHHYKDGLAFKFYDDTFETKLTGVEWNTSRSGEIFAVALFDTAIIDGCNVSRATLHNLDIIEGLELNIGCRILVCKRGQIIPHIEENLDRGNGVLEFPKTCLCCGEPTTIKISKVKGVERKSIHCKNEECPARNLKKFVHHVSKKAINIEGLSESTLEKFFDMGWLTSFVDIYNLSRYESEIVTMDGFGAKSYAKIIGAIEKSRNTTFERFLIGMDIPLVGSHASAALKKVYNGDPVKFREAVNAKQDFTTIDDIGATINGNIYKWFASDINCRLWDDLYVLMTFEATASSVPSTQDAGENPFNGLTVVPTGSFKNFTNRDGITTKLKELGAKPTSAVSKNTNYVIAGTKPTANKLKKAEELGILVITEDEFFEMIEG